MFGLTITPQGYITLHCIRWMARGRKRNVSEILEIFNPTATSFPSRSPFLLGFSSAALPPRLFPPGLLPYGFCGNADRFQPPPSPFINSTVDVIRHVGSPTFCRLVLQRHSLCGRHFEIPHKSAARAKRRLFKRSLGGIDGAALDGRFLEQDPQTLTKRESAERL
jgi:hypothetical protein